jgi:dynein heavy chain
VTINLGYTGRSELPDNLKSLLRPISMMVFDSSLIVKIELISEGIGAEESLSRKIVTIYHLCQKNQYIFDLRAIKSVLSMAESLKRKTTSNAHEMIILHPITNMNIPKLVNEDIPLFNSIINNLFSGLELEASNNNQIEKVISESLEAAKFQHDSNLIEKIMQLREIMLTRHENIVVGRTGSAKTIS